MKKRMITILMMLFVLSISSVSFAKLEQGMNSPEVQYMQYMLIDAGYLSNGADGVFGSGTRAAVQQFQSDHGLTVDGIVGNQTLAALVQADTSATSVVFRCGDSGDAVRDIQTRLSNNGYSVGTIDGIYGGGTANAVSTFQSSLGLAATGILDVRTERALYALGNSASLSSNTSAGGQEIVMQATAYSAHDPGNSGYTAGGHALIHGLVSVDPSVIPLGTKLYIEGYGYAVADDTGGDITGTRIDLGMNSNSEAMNFGRRDVVVHILG